MKLFKQWRSVGMVCVAIVCGVAIGVTAQTMHYKEEVKKIAAGAWFKVGDKIYHAVEMTIPILRRGNR